MTLLHYVHYPCNPPPLPTPFQPHLQHRKTVSFNPFPRPPSPLPLPPTPLPLPPPPTPLTHPSPLTPHLSRHPPPARSGSGQYASIFLSILIY